MLETVLAPHALAKLRWRCRRGMLENDLFVERFFERHEHEITPVRANTLGMLMDLSDNDLLDLLLGRKEPVGDLDTPNVREVLAMLRARPRAAP
jgi:antitoxin CptB